MGWVLENVQKCPVVHILQVGAELASSSMYLPAGHCVHVDSCASVAFAPTCGWCDPGRQGIGSALPSHLCPGMPIGTHARNRSNIR